MNRIAQLRKAAGLSQSELAKHLGIAQNTLSQYENEVRKPTSQLIMDVATSFGVTPEYVLNAPKEPTKEDNTQTQTGLSNVTKVIRLYDEEYVNLCLEMGFKLLYVGGCEDSDGVQGIAYCLGWFRDPSEIPVDAFGPESACRYAYDEDNGFHQVKVTRLV